MRHHALCALVAVPSRTVPAVHRRRRGGRRSADARRERRTTSSHPDWGRAGTAVPAACAAPNYADGRAAPVTGPSARYVSNRIFNDTSQNLFSENGVTQWGAVWGQFLDHTFGLRQETGGERAPLALSTPRIRSSRSATTSARSRSSARRRRPGPAPRRRASS